MKNYFFKKLFKPLPFGIILIFLISFVGDFLNAEFLSEELQIDTSTKNEDDSSFIPTNPFEIVEKIRRYNSLNDATKPSDAIDDALELFNTLGDEKDI